MHVGSGRGGKFPKFQYQGLHPLLYSSNRGGSLAQAGEGPKELPSQVEANFHSHISNWAEVQYQATQHRRFPTSPKHTGPCQFWGLTTHRRWARLMLDHRIERAHAEAKYDKEAAFDSYFGL